MYKVAVDDDKKAVLSAINIITTSHEMSWFLCGAYSRVLLCEDVLKIPAGRATYDLDVAICVKSLEKFKKFRNSLCSNDIFIQNSKMEHRFTHHSSGTIVDVIPFGKFAEPEESYDWGVDNSFRMNVQGFSEAFLSSITFLVNSNLEIQVAGYTEQFVLKLFAWKDRRFTRGIDDASDLAFFLLHALKSISEKALYDKYYSVLEEADYDIELASCFVLGQQIKSVFSRQTVFKIIEILNSNLQAREDSTLMSDMYSRFSSWPQPDERIFAVLNQVVKGLFAENI